MTYTNRSTRALLTIACVACAAVLPGCIIQDIRDDLRGANERLDRVDTLMTQANARLDKVDTRLEQVEVTNASLESLQRQLELLQSIDTSLKNLDVHLASLRKTIASIDSAIPFLSISGDDDEPTDEAAEGTVEGEDGTTPDEAAPDAGSSPDGEDNGVMEDPEPGSDAPDAPSDTPQR
ncbi:MAG: hypothetical protein RBS39_03030 [Phycisphaerales bacterium]|jgi:K+-sensing histidine kinase KdpD|nr:hypothetical protein [Phycisphaerales bacterium]